MKSWKPHKKSAVFLEIFQAQDFSDQEDLKNTLVPFLKDYLSLEQKKIEAIFLKKRKGLACARALSSMTDDIIRVIFDALLLQLDEKRRKPAAQNLCIIATGGYGRATRAPYSDIDILFLLSEEQREFSEQIAKSILYILWDLKLKVGYHVCTSEESLELSETDLNMRTALLEMRRITGNQNLFNNLKQKFYSTFTKKPVAAFVNAKLQERDARLSKAGESRYLLEPNIKEGKGGLRDLHTLSWIFRSVALVSHESLEEIKEKVILRGENRLFNRCERFLWCVRCHMHFISGRAGEILTFDLQQQIAKRMGYTDSPNFSAVERFMKSYYLVAKDVGVLTAYLCAALEAQHVKSIPSLDRTEHVQTTQSKRAFLNNPYFIRDNGRLTIKRADAFTAHPVNLIRFFWLADRYYIPLHPHALHQARLAHKCIDKNLRKNPDANRLFLDILTSRTVPEKILSAMNDTSVLGQFLPEFGRIVGMMQFNMYHSYTVDEHLLRTVGTLTSLEKGSIPEAERIAVSLSEENRRELYVAALLHDIAKGSSGDHSTQGAALIRKIGPRLGLTADETDTVSWLIREHLLMSDTAQRRDLNDPSTIQTFSEKIQSRERLKLLYLLTIADIKAVGPSIWTPWKGQLLQTLYLKTDMLLNGMEFRDYQKDIAKNGRYSERNTPDLPDGPWRQSLKRFGPSYAMKVDLQTQKQHAQLIAGFDAEQQVCRWSIIPDYEHDLTIITLCALTHSELLSVIAGSCAASEANIIGAQVFTSTDGFTLVTIALARSFDLPEDDMRQSQRIIKCIQQVLKRQISLPQVVQNKKQKKNKITVFNTSFRVVIDNTSSKKLTLLEVTGLDRPGLLYELTQIVAQFKMIIHSAHIATFGEKVIDTFYVTTDQNEKLIDENEKQLLSTALNRVLKV